MATIHERLASEIESAPADATRDVRKWLESVPSVRQLIVGALIRGLGATKFYFDKAAGKMVHEPDYLAQTKAAALLVAYSDGLPVQSTVNVNLDPSKGQGFSLGDALASSPALREHLAKELAASERKAIAA